MALGISPLVDFAFKAMLGDPAHAGVTIHFLNAILAPPLIREVTFLNPFLPQEADDDKLGVLDILATDELGRRLNIEVQTALAPGLGNRLTYYAARLYADGLGKGEAYSDLKAAISICVLRKSLFPHLPQLHLDFRLREAGGEVLTEALQVHLLELPKAPRLTNNRDNGTPLERWSQFLLYAHELEWPQLARRFPEPPLREAAGVLEMISQTPEQKLQYEARLKHERDMDWLLKSARDEAAREGLSKGIAEGRAEGQSLGRIEGLQQGALIGRIQALEEVLGRPLTAFSELERLSLEELSRSLTQLQAEFQRTRVREG